MKCIFFDRDGIINKRLMDNYVMKIEEFEFIDDIFPILKFADDHNFLKIVVTNQQGVGKGLMSDKELIKIHEYMNQELEKRTIKRFDEIHYCTDLKNTGSKRRKPEPGMLLEAIEKFGIDPKESWMIGDTDSDMLAGKRAGVKTILISDLVSSKHADYYFKEHKDLIKDLEDVIV